MKVTVIAIAFNCVSTLVEALESVVMQTHPDIEHILVDGASGVGTRELIATDGAPPARDNLVGLLDSGGAGRKQPVVRCWQAGSLSTAKLKCGWMQPHPTLQGRRELMEALGLFDAPMRIPADCEFMQ